MPLQDLDLLWQKTLDILQAELSKSSFETWLRSTQLVSYNGKNIVIAAPNPFAKDWLESRYRLLIKNTIQLLLDREIEIEFILPYEISNAGSAKNVNTINKGKPAPSYDGSVPCLLNPKYTFNTFVIGNSNRFAHAAAQAVSEAPAKSYNPLFIYGGVGLGKTHLMQAIGHYVLDKSPQYQVVYVSSEKFTNELINSIRDDKTEEFRTKYRNIDVLLVDDIQFLAGKERTQEEFFHTFNTLHEANKQIIISSDRPPKEIPTLEDRLRSRFEWGLITDIQPPDLETRIAILRKKAQMEDLNLPDDVMVYIANRIQSNIRELEGAILRVAAYALVSKQEVTLELAVAALKDLVQEVKTKRINISLIQQTVASYFGLRLDDFKAKKRTRAVAYPRQIAMFLSRELTDTSLPRIGEEFGGRDHTTVIHACDKISTELENDAQLKQMIEDLNRQLLAALD